MPKTDPTAAQAIPLEPTTCPLCKKPATQAHRPFCSKRCADLDLGKWLNESYVVAASDDDEPGQENED